MHTRHHQAGDIAAGDQQHQENGAQKNQQRAAGGADNRSVEWPDRRGSSL